MRKRDIRINYRTYGYRSNAPLVSLQDQWIAYFNKKFDGIDVNVEFDTDGIIEAVDNSKNEIIEVINNTETNIENNITGTLEDKFNEVNEHIESAKSHLCCDICRAKKDIKKHIDDKFAAANFEQHFSDLNEQVAEILNKLEQ